MSFPVQDAVLTAQPAGIPGLTVSGSTEPGINAEASASLQFGIMVQQFAEGQFKILSGGTNKLAGPVVFEHLFDPTNQVSSAGVAPKAICNVGRRWRGWVRIEEDVAVGDAVRCRHTVTAAEVLGSFRKTADTTKCFVLSSIASWRTGGTAALGYAELEIDMTNGALAVSD